MKLFINSYKAGSKSVKALKEGLSNVGIEAKVLKKVNSKYVNKHEHLVLNWGDSKCQPFYNTINNGASVLNASNKATTMELLSKAAVRTVPYFTNKGDAIEFLEAKEGRMLYCRTKLNGSQGDGIVVARTKDEVVDSMLYTGGLSNGKRREYRVHVFNGEVILTQQKRRRNGYRDNPDYSNDVRNLKGGWVFTKQEVGLSEETIKECVDSVKALGLVFGAVDVLESSNGKCWVLEVNTACGLEGTTVDTYVEAIKKKYDEALENVVVW